MIKKIFSMLILVVLAVGIFSMAVYAQGEKPFTDTEGHWAEDLLAKKYEQGLITGYPDGSFNPDGILTRGELVTVINRSFGLSKVTDNQYKDIAGSEWFSREADKAYYYEYVKDNKLKGNEPATRMEAVKMIANLLDLEVDSETGAFSDVEKLTEEEKLFLDMFAEMGYLQGDGDGKANPDRTLTRAETITLTDNVLGYIVTSEEDLENMPETGRVTIIGQNITIKGKNIESLYISPGVFTDTIIRNTTIKNTLEIANEGTDGNAILDDVTAENVEVRPKAKDLTLEMKGETKVKTITMENEGTITAEANVEIDDIIIEEGKPILKDVKVRDDLIIESGQVNLINNDLNDVIITGESKVVTDEKTVIYDLDIEAKTEITGESKIKDAYIKADGVDIEIKPRYTRVAGGISANVAGKETTSSNDNPKSSSSKKSSNSTPPVLSSDSSLSGITVGNQSLTDFDSSLITYNVELPHGTNTVPNISAAASDNKANVIITQAADTTGSASILVTAEDGSTTTYTVNFSVAPPANNAPIVANELNDIKSGKVGTEISVDLSNVFTDSDSDTLTLTADIGTITDTMWKFTPTDTNDVTVNITVDDGKGGSVIESFTISGITETVTITGITIKTEPTKIIYAAGETLDLSGLEVTLAKSDSSTEDVALDNFAAQGITTAPQNGAVLNNSNTSVTISGYGHSVEQSITVKYEMQGSGTEHDPFLVESPEDLVVIGRDLRGSNDKYYSLSAHYKLVKDIDLENDPANGTYEDILGLDKYDVDEDNNKTETLAEALDAQGNGKGFKLIGDYLSYTKNPFTGVFDGDNHTISHLYINRPDTNYTGLFGFIDGEDVEIKNIKLEDADITGAGCVGSLVGGTYWSSTTTTPYIHHCYAAGQVTGEYSIGGLVGSIYYTQIEDCSAVVDVTGKKGNVGGLIGYGQNSKVNNSYAQGDIIVSGDYSTPNKNASIYRGIGGLVGNFQCFTDTLAIENCYATGNLSASGDLEVTEEYKFCRGCVAIGGLVGYIKQVNVSNSYAAGDITNSMTFSGPGIKYDGTGGLIGFIDSSGEVINTIALNQNVTSSLSNTGRVVGNGGTLHNNYANNNMKLNGINVINGQLDDNNGADITAEQFKNTGDFMSTAANWDITNGSAWDFTPDTGVWEIKTGAVRPTLQVIGDDDGKEMRTAL
jgi:hypothetical protein